MKRIFFPVVFAILLPFAAFAVEPDEILDDPVLEARAREVSQELRCVVCQNQDIDSSNAGVARDLRLLVRERLKNGDTNNEVLAFVQARYGDYVLLKPPFKPSTYALWAAPPVLMLFALIVGLTVVSRSRRKTVSAGLSAEEEKQVTQFIETEKARSAP